MLYFITEMPYLQLIYILNWKFGLEAKFETMLV